MKSTEKPAKSPASVVQSDSVANAGEVAASSAPTKRPRLSSARIPFAIVIVLTLLSGIIHGVLDGRWTKSEDLIAKGSKLLQAPEKVGDWTLVETRELAEDANELLRPHGTMVRVYRHEPSAINVTVAILFGPRGPIAVHTPEVCYSSIGTEQIGKRKVETVRHGTSEDKFWSVKFAEDPAPDPSLDVWYAWSDGNGWIASQYPRFWMVDNLYKLQIAGPIGTTDFRPCRKFLTEFLPKANPLLQ